MATQPSAPAKPSAVTRPQPEEPAHDGFPPEKDVSTPPPGSDQDPTAEGKKTK